MADKHKIEILQRRIEDAESENAKLHCTILELENQIMVLESDINNLQSNKMFMAGQIEAYKHCIENIGG